eukprot:Amastigsp_a1718_15.p3 type:complete len:138 gc:universal Amastigsp_a1718_15:585-172(-)
MRPEQRIMRASRRIRSASAQDRKRGYASDRRMTPTSGSSSAPLNSSSQLRSPERRATVHADSGPASPVDVLCSYAYAQRRSSRPRSVVRSSSMRYSLLGSSRRAAVSASSNATTAGIGTASDGAGMGNTHGSGPAPG